MDLRLVGASAHDPVAIGRNADARRRLFKLEVLEKLDAVGVFSVLLQTPLAFAGKPFRQRAGARGTCDGIHRHGSLGGELHGGWRMLVKMLKSEAAQEKGIAGDFTQTAATFLNDPTVWKLPAPASLRAASGAACLVWE
jgi:hypothetical protein